MPETGRTTNSALCRYAAHDIFHVCTRRDGRLLTDPDEECFAEQRKQLFEQARVANAVEAYEMHLADDDDRLERLGDESAWSDFLAGHGDPAPSAVAHHRAPVAARDGDLRLARLCIAALILWSVVSVVWR